MTRLARGMDRAATLLVGILLLVVGILAILWWFDIVFELPRSSNTDGIADVLTSSWWPWVSGIVGVVLILVGLRWLLAHLPSNGVKELNLSGTGDDGRLSFNASSAASAAAKQFSQLPSVRSAKGRVTRDRGQLVVALDATIDPAADLNELAKAADQIIADLAQVMGRHDLYGRVRLRVGSSSRSQLLRVE